MSPLPQHRSIGSILRRGWAALVSLLLLFAAATPSLAVSAAGFPEQEPMERVLDGSEVLSRAANAEVSRQLEALEAHHVDAHLVTVDRLDYGVSLRQLGQQLLERWSGQGNAEGNGEAGGEPQLLFLIDSKTNTAAVVASPALKERLDAGLLKSTARTTMAQPIREGARFRQASLEGIARLQAVLETGVDPGEPLQVEATTLPTNVPTREETADSQAFTWVIVLLVVGTVVPMATWWVFSR